MNCMKGNEQIGKIVLSLDNNFILPEDKLSHTPSEADGLDKEIEIDLRILGCEIIQTIGILLKLPQVAMGTGQMAWNYMNDALRTDVFVRYQPETIACACIYLSARMLKVCLPESPPWFGLFQVLEADIKDVCFRLLHLYLRPKPSSEKLLLKVAELERQKEYSRASSKLNDLDNECSKDEAKVDANGFHTKQTKSTDVISQVETIAAVDSESNDRDKRPKKSRRHHRDSKHYDRTASPRYRKSSQYDVNGKEDVSREGNYRSHSRDDARRSHDRPERKERKHRHYDDEHYEKYESSSNRHKRKKTR